MRAQKTMSENRGADQCPINAGQIKGGLTAGLTDLTDPTRLLVSTPRVEGRG